MDVSVVDLPQAITPHPSLTPTFIPTQSSNANANQKNEDWTLYVLIPVGVVVLGMILCTGYFIFRHKFHLSRTHSYEKNSVHFIQRKQTKQIHCVSLPF